MNCGTRSAWRPGRSRARGEGGFTLAEVLAALLFMAIVIPVAVQGLRLSSQAGVQAERSASALQLGDALLQEMAIGGRYREMGTAGTFGSEWPGYHWQLQVEPWGRGPMRLLRMEVFFPAQHLERSVQLSTLVSE
jgi:type II secretory pathway pseudopilin PulG